MGLAEIVRSGVSIANRVTGSLQATVQHEAWTGVGAYGAPAFDSAATRPAIVEHKTRRRRLESGEEINQVAAVTIIGPIAANGATGRREPIDPRDRITLPNGYIGPILDVQGIVDPSTGLPYMYVVAIGERG